MLCRTFRNLASYRPLKRRVGGARHAQRTIIVFDDKLIEDENETGTLLDYDPAPPLAIWTLLDKVNLKEHEVFYDFGCGDGRWCIEASREYGCKSVGIEVDAGWAEKAKRAVTEARLDHLVKILHVDGFEQDLSNADVISTYYVPQGVSLLGPKLERELKPGARVIALKNPFKGWIPDSKTRLFEFYGYTYTFPVKKEKD